MLRIARNARWQRQIVGASKLAKANRRSFEGNLDVPEFVGQVWQVVVVVNGPN